LVEPIACAEDDHYNRHDEGEPELERVRSSDDDGY
jgi:hypothetical protein